MGLFGALFAGVAGLGSQSNKIGIVSNNISNVNTVGYKQGSAAFNTLVVPGATSGVFSPGGVLGNNRQLVSQQGLIQATTSNTDIAISGGGLFVVNTKPDGSGDTLYTRAGSFTPDANGNFKNQAGFYLMGMTISDPQPEPNSRLLTTVNVNPNATGSSVATSAVTLKANFNATQLPLQGAGETATLVGDTTNANNSLSQILIPTTGASGNNLKRGDSFDVVLGGATSYSFTYGGFEVGRNVTSGAIGDGGYKLQTNTISTGAAVTSPATGVDTLSGITLSSSSAGSATVSGALSPGTLSYGGSAAITVRSIDTLATVAANLQAALRARSHVPADTTSTVAISASSPYTLTVTDSLDSSTGFSGTALTANTAPTPGALGGTTTTTQSITIPTAGLSSDSGTEKGGFVPGTLTWGTGSGTTATITITAGQSLDTIAANLQIAMRDPNRVGDTTSTVAVVSLGGGNFRLDITDTLVAAGSVGLAGSSLAGSTVGATPAGSITHTGSAIVTSSALTNITVTDKTVAGGAVASGLFAVGTINIGGVTPINVTGTDSLQDVADNIQTALRARGGDTTSTAVVTGSPGNYQITVNDVLGTGLGFTTGGSGNAIVSGTTMNVVAPTQTPALSQITFTLASAPDAANYVVGKTAYVNGLTTTLGGTATTTAVNGQNLIILAVDTATGKVTLGLPPTISGGVGTGLGGTNITITNRTFDYAGNMLDAAGDSDDFLGVSGTAAFVNGATTFSATVNGTSYAFSYTSTPNTSLGQFNNLSSLVTAINTASGGNITASLVNHQLYISATDTSKGITFQNGQAVGSAAGAGHLPGIDWIQELDLKNIDDAASGVSRFDSLQSLADQVNQIDPANIGATVGTRTISINAIDPQVQIEFLDTNTNFGGSVISALGFKAVGGGNLSNNPIPMSNGGTGYSSDVFAGVYSATDPTKNMSSGAVTPQFSKDITVYDALGIGHTITLNIAKLSSLKWSVELTSVPPTDVISANGATATDGLISSGIVTFSGDGKLLGITGLGNGGLSPIQVNWTTAGGGAVQSNIQFKMGSIGETDGLSQFSGSSNVSQALQNGAPTGQLTGVNIDESGFVVASFSNGQTQKLYQIPLAGVNNPNGLDSVSGNAYKQTLASGEVTLNYAGENGNGTLAASALEQSNVDLSTQLTDLIVAQQAYGANTRVLTVTSQLLQQLNQIIQ